MRLKVFYSVRNGGDGSAYPTFMESKELAEFDQAHMNEGWGESCAGSILFESDSEIRCLNKITTKESYLIEQYGNTADEERHEFISQFFPNGLPKFTVETEKSDKGYTYNNVLVDGKHVAKVFKLTSESGQIFENFLNSL